MKFIHLSDLHLGKRLKEFSMIEDQEYILTKIINIIDDEKPQAVIIAGDIYDRSVPPVEAIRLFDDFLGRLAKRELHTFIISGNHDSPERIAFGSRFMDKSGIHISPVYNGKVEAFPLKDEFGKVCVYMLPFVKPANVRGMFEDEEIVSYTDAVRCAVSHMEIDDSSRNIIVTHQFVTGAERSDSEEISVGGTDNVDASVFDRFDYVALGHIHGPQNIGRETVRYCGTPLKYSFSEQDHKKSVTVVEMYEKGNTKVRTVKLEAMHDMREIRGTYEELTMKKNYENTAVDDYLHIILTDEEDVYDAMGRLRNIYPNLMKLDYDNERTRADSHITAVEGVRHKPPQELFAEFYEKQNGQAMSEEQRQFSQALFEEIWEEGS